MMTSLALCAAVGQTLLAADVTLPDNAGYVVGAYLVFLVLLLIYVSIMASKLSRFERELTELNRIAEERDAV
jgi:uncharacterized protein (DUF58 family)